MIHDSEVPFLGVSGSFGGRLVEFDELGGQMTWDEG